ncbi:hypothetical protein ACEQ85_09775 [Acinetobacter pittii]|uniref:hypothetical protein n=1 Tax=Acinetobacter pittii TaxID=48296 RepID=UPI00289E73D1|nr:hypothetical protein [Acinetobacter oleivorans]
MEPKKVRVIVSTASSSSNDISSRVAKGHKHLGFLAGFFISEKKQENKNISAKQCA